MKLHQFVRLNRQIKFNNIIKLNLIQRPLNSFVGHNFSTCHRPLLQQANPNEGRMLIGFTCKVCNHRTHKTFSKTAYEKGVVLIQCPSCENRHLIADNLGWFRDNKVNVETLMNEKGENVKFVQGGELEATEWVPKVVEEENEKVRQLEAEKQSKPE